MTGPSDTFGYADVYIAKSLIANAQDIKAYLDGYPIGYAVSSLDDSWLVHFTYPYSTHTITIGLSSVSFFGIPFETAVILTGLVLVAVVLGVLYVLRKMKKGGYLRFLNSFVPSISLL